jgi:sulfite reductase beta subunit-like hemoprotein
MNAYKVYSGRIGCMCGCKGKYSYTAKGAVENSPGYDVTDSINERSVKIITTKLLRNPNTKRDEGTLVLEQNGRILVAWLDF